MGRVVGVKGGRRRPGLDEAHDITTIEVSSRTNGLRFFLCICTSSFTTVEEGQIES